MSALTFKLHPNATAVTLEGDHGNEEYELREMTAAARDVYMDSLQLRLSRNAQGDVVGIKKFEQMQADLLTRCMFRKKENTPVPVSEIQKWPASVVASLYTEAQTMNRLNQKAEGMVEEAKKE